MPDCRLRARPAYRRPRRRDLPLRLFRKVWYGVAYKHYINVTTTLSRWIDPPKPPAVEPWNVGLPAPLPKGRRALSISSSAKPAGQLSSLLPRCLKNIGGKQYIAAQKGCLFLNKLPPEIRLQIYYLTLPTATSLHIIPSLAPSLTPPPRYTLRPQPFYSRLDYQICKLHQSRIIGVKRKDSSGVADLVLDPDPHTRCWSWMVKEGVFYFKVQGARSQTRGELEGRYERWWKKREGGVGTALVKTCRLIYNETMPLLYTTNTFIFPSPEKFSLFNRSLPPSRLSLLRQLHLHFILRGNPCDHAPQVCSSKYSWCTTCMLLRALPSLRTLTMVLEDKRKDGAKEPLLAGLTGLQVAGEFTVYVDWPETEWEKTTREFAFKIVRVGF